MDVYSFNAVYKFVSRQHGEVPPPRLVLAVLTYLEGLGYEVVCRGDEAAAYADEGVASGPARHMDWEKIGLPSTQEHDDSSYWYALDLVHDTLAQHVVDQMLVHVRMTAVAAFVHCSRTVWVRPKEPSSALSAFRRVEVGTSTHTSCTLSGDGMVELYVDRFDDGAGLRNVDDLCATLQSFFCKGSAREAGEAAMTTAGAGAAVSLRPSPDSDYMGGYDGRDGRNGPDGYDGAGSDVERHRVGQSDLDPIDRRGAGRGLGPDGMMVGPHHPMFGRGRMEPPPGHEGHIPPAARWDPISPPGVPGFFPGDFERGRGRGRGRRGDDVHPDIMQPGRGGFGTGFDGFGSGGF
jgi:hypothetical protein